MSQGIKEKVSKYILEELIKDNPTKIMDDTELISGGYIDSINTLKLVVFIEKEFNIDFEAHEVDPDYLNSLILIENTIKSKSS